MTNKEQAERKEISSPVTFYFDCIDGDKRDIWIRPQPLYSFCALGNIPSVSLTVKAGLSKTDEPILNMYVDNQSGYQPARIGFYQLQTGKALKRIPELPEKLTFNPASLPAILFGNDLKSDQLRSLGLMLTAKRETMPVRPLSILVVGGNEKFAGQMAVHGNIQTQTCDEFEDHLDELSKEIWQKLHVDRKDPIKESEYYAAQKALISARFPQDVICFGTPPKDKINFALGIENRRYYFELSQTLLLFAYTDTENGLPTPEEIFLSKIADLAFFDVNDTRLKQLFKEYQAFRPTR